MNASELEAARTLLHDTSVQMAIERVRAEARLRTDPSEVSWLALAHTIVAAHESARRKFPKARDVGRVGDMAPADQGHMRVLLDTDGDAIVSIWDAHTHPSRPCTASIEFCTAGAGGGQSPRTRRRPGAVDGGHGAGQPGQPARAISPHPPLITGERPTMQITFNHAGDFEAMDAAERWCAERGISVGHMQGHEPRGLLFGSFDVAKWRNLTGSERAALHGTMTGSRRGPVTVSLKDAAVAEHRPQLLQDKAAA